MPRHTKTEEKESTCYNKKILIRKAVIRKECLHTHILVYEVLNRNLLNV